MSLKHTLLSLQSLSIEKVQRHLRSKPLLFYFCLLISHGFFPVDYIFFFVIVIKTVMLFSICQS